MSRKGPRAAHRTRYTLRRRFLGAQDLTRPALPHPASAAKEPAPDGAAESAQAQADTEEVALLRETIARQRAEFENLRKRTQREKEQVREFATEGLLNRLLPVLDNLERAMASADKAVDIKSVRDGVSMIAVQFTRALESEGLQQVNALHAQFDPAFHDALAAEERDDVEDGKVCEVLLPGYTYKEKLLRPAMVKVARRPSGSGSGNK